jgi:hypothetical protein
VKIAGVFAADDEAVPELVGEVVNWKPPTVSIDIGCPSNLGLVQLNRHEAKGNSRKMFVQTGSTGLTACSRIVIVFRWHLRVSGSKQTARLLAIGDDARF